MIIYVQSFKSDDKHGNLHTSMKINENQSKSMKIIENQCKRKEKKQNSIPIQRKQ